MVRNGISANGISNPFYHYEVLRFIDTKYRSAKNGSCFGYGTDLGRVRDFTCKIGNKLNLFKNSFFYSYFWIEINFPCSICMYKYFIVYAFKNIYFIMVS